MNRRARLRGHPALVQSPLFHQVGDPQRECALERRRLDLQEILRAAAAVLILGLSRVRSITAF